MEFHPLFEPIKNTEPRKKNGRYDQTKKFHKDGYDITLTVQPSGHYVAIVQDKAGHIVHHISSGGGAPDESLDEQVKSYLQRWPGILRDIQRDEESKEETTMREAGYEDTRRKFEKG